MCKGCGTCVAACPAGAITGTGFNDEQIFAEIEGLLRVGADGTPLRRPAYPVAANDGNSHKASAELEEVARA